MTLKLQQKSKLHLEEVGPHQWVFIYPNEVSQLSDVFWEAVEMLGENKLKEAETILRDLLDECKEYIDAYYHLAIILDNTDRSDEARELLHNAFNIARQAFPQKFKAGTDLLEWGWIENRPFLRVCEELAMSYFRRDRIEEAVGFFREILHFNPKDNQGVRALIIDAYFDINQPEETLKICRKYPDDILPDTNYGKVLALLKLNRKKQALTALKKAHGNLPLVAEELMKEKHRKPKPKHEGYITIGGKDQAYEYWESTREYWNSTPGAIEFVRAFMAERSHS